MCAVRPARERGRTYSYSWRDGGAGQTTERQCSRGDTYERILVALGRHVVLHVLDFCRRHKVLAPEKLSDRCRGRLGDRRKVGSVVERLTTGRGGRKRRARISEPDGPAPRNAEKQAVAPYAARAYASRHPS